MSAEAERIFGKSSELITGPDIADEFEERLENIELLFFAAISFFQDPEDTEPHPLLAEVSRDAFGKKEEIEILPNHNICMDLPVFNVLDENYAQIQVPPDYLEIADTAPTDVLFHAAWMGSKIRDFSKGWCAETEDSDARAQILQAEFLLWWVDASRELGVSNTSREAHETVLSAFPDGIKSLSARPFVRSMGLEAGWISDSFQPIRDISLS